jgi:flagellar biosynthetic protein FliR
MFGALPAEVYGAGLVFCRVGALIMLIPGIGESSIPPRIRLGLALVLSLAFYPILRAGMPPVPGTVGGLAAQVIVEILIGVAIGSLLRMFLGALSVAGETISLQTNLSFAQTANPQQAQPSTTVGTFLSLLGISLIFATDLHQMFIAAIVKSYALFPMGRGFNAMDFGQLAIQTVGQVFALGIQLAAPVVVFSLVFNIAVGFVGRAMPQFQIFFVATPLSVLLGLSILAMSLGMFGLVWVDRFRAFVDRFAS